jgi:hypothetical protein
MASVGSFVTASRSRIDRPHKKQKAKVDIISKLPDSLITHILSCLPTKDAVRTSVLSKRWIDCWTLITKLNFDDSVFYSSKRKKSGGKQHFINFVNRVLLFTQRYNVERFSLVITNKYDVSLLNTWISCILKKHVKMISISTNLELPFSEFTTRTLFNHIYNLEELILKMCDCAIKLPPNPTHGYFIFGRLKVLKLCGIIFTIDKSQGIIFSVLKKFETKNCSWLSAHYVTLRLSAPLLESVYIEQNHKSVTREPHRCTVTFSAPCMKEFTYCGDGISQVITLSDPSSARNASANIILRRQWRTVQETGSCVCILLKQFSQVKCIKFHGSEVRQYNLPFLILY